MKDRRVKRIGFASIALLLTLVLAAPAAALEFGARAYWWFPNFSADLRADLSGIAGTTTDMKEVLGVGNKSYPSVEAYFGAGRHHLSAQYTPVNYSGTTTLVQPVTFRGVTYNPGAYVETDLKLRMIDVEYQFDLLNLENILAGFSLGPILKVKYLDGEARLNAPAILAGDQKETFGVPVPMVGLGAHVGLLANILEARARVTGIAYSGSWFLEGLADVSWTPFPFLDIHGGYKIMKLKVDRSELYLNSQFAGPYVAVTVGF